MENKRELKQTPIDGEGRLHGPDGEKCADDNSSATLANRLSKSGAPQKTDGGQEQAVVGSSPRKKVKKQLVVCYFKVTKLPAESRKRLYDAAIETRNATNYIYNTWQQEMLKAGHDDDLRIFFHLYAKWKKDKTLEKPVLEFSAIDKSLEKKLRSMLLIRCVTLHSRCAGLTLKAATEKIRRYPYSAGLKLWQAVLLGHANLPVSQNELPIRFDRQNAQLEEHEGEIYLSVRVSARQVAGKVNRVSEKETMQLVLPDKASKKKYVQLAREAARGERPWAGSQIVYKAKKRQWMVALVVETDSDPPLPSKDEDVESATLSAPEEKTCWRLEFGDNEFCNIGGGARVKHLRTRLHHAKELRQADPMSAPSRNGHGRKRKLRDFSKMSGRWKNTTKTLNNQAVARIVKEMELVECRKLIYTAPSEKSLLQTAGREFGPGWPVFQFEEILQRKCRGKGIAFEFFAEESDVSAKENGSCGE